MNACVLVSGAAAWAFEPLAEQLARHLDIPIATEPKAFNYMLSGDRPETVESSFIPYVSIALASDKRLIAHAFKEEDVPTPKTFLVESREEAQELLRDDSREWCLKFPTSCGAAGHRIVRDISEIPTDWPRPFVLQEFIRLRRPEVFRTYAAAGEVFGWMVRRFPSNAETSPWVAHARGAIYEDLGDPPSDAVIVARKALSAADLLNSFGCVDLLPSPNGGWLALEVGTDGIFNYVDREIGSKKLSAEINSRLAEAFWNYVRIEAVKK